MIRRRGQRDEEESSSDDEDAFAALSKKTKRPRPESDSVERKKNTDSASKTHKMVLPHAITSSMKRHHKPNDDRKAKMDALLQELEADKEKVTKEPYRFVPDKKGSFVDPSEEHLTTNIFVGNLAPSITEEDLTELFLQFGDLYSIKIMWPRTTAERSRKRNTGFVCFMNREDAEEAMEACNEADPFNVGRLLMLRWGKNVKRNFQQGTSSSLPTHPMQEEERETIGPISSVFEDPEEIFLREDGVPSMIEFNGPDEPIDISKAAKFLPGTHAENAIRVKVPTNPDRFHFISTIASFISKDGSQLEQTLMEHEGSNPQYNFLVYSSAKTQAQQEEHIFYRWRVYSFCQGDTFSHWRTEPFVMFHPNGRYWIPPPLDRAASSREREKFEERNENVRLQKEKRTNERAENKAKGKKEFHTGRQIERARNNRLKGGRRNPNWDVGTNLLRADKEKFDLLVCKKLSISRESICTAMAFCFEKSGAAQEIAALLKHTLLDDSPHVTVDMRIARLYLLSDVLFNSQQPGVRNAFMYRDALEKMAPEIFTSLGRHGSGQVGRMTLNKLRTAVSTVLGAWTEWSVYNPAFLDELEARFSGKEIKCDSSDQNATLVEGIAETSDTTVQNEEKIDVIITEARGDWKEVAEDDENIEDNLENYSDSSREASVMQQKALQSDTAEPTDAQYLRRPQSILNSRGALETDSADFDQTNSDFRPSVGEFALKPKGVHEVTEADHDLDGEPIEEDGIDGIPMDSEEVDDVDGEALEESDIDGEVLNEDEYMKRNEQDYLDGEVLDDQDQVHLNGEDIDGEELDGDVFDEHDV